MIALCWVATAPCQASDDTRNTDAAYDKMRVLWIDMYATCASETVFSNIIAEVDDLPIAFQRVSISSEVALTQGEAPAKMLAVKQADVALWYSCSAGALHIFSGLLDADNQTRTIEPDENGETPIEAVTAVARNWLEGLLNLWEKRPHHGPDADAAFKEDASLNGEIGANEATTDSKGSTAQELDDSAFGEFSRETGLDADDEVILDTELAGNASSRAVNRRIVYPGMGLIVSSPGNNRLIPGGYAAITARLWRFGEVGISGSVMKSVTFRQSGVTTTLGQYPVSAYAGAMFPQNGVMFVAMLGFELTFMRRDVQTADVELLAAAWKTQPACLGTVGVAVPMGTRFFWIFQLGARVVLQSTELQIEVGDAISTIFSPWRVQPVMFTGLQVGVF
ncbi:MAG: hypothetical protein JXX14_11080 [Deltaproteobacteria bacterium]|nr:hypothetical protein [Deltaproteobacteria bacterium]